jgi:transcriptional regulator with XRE-family HTH domain
MNPPRVSRDKNKPTASLRVRVGRTIKRHRLVHGWTQAELGAKAGFSAKYVGEIERGTANLTIEVLEVFGRLLEWDPTKLVSPAGRGAADGVRRVLRVELRHLAESINLIVNELEPVASAPRDDR